MELKRYVLMNNGKILDLRKIGFTKYISIEEMVKNYGKVKSTSDNILDFVEVGDLVNGSQCIYASEVTKIDDKEIYTSIWCHWKNEIDTIWKKQPNGDYKKYEVK